MCWHRSSSSDAGTERAGALAERVRGAPVVPHRPYQTGVSQKGHGASQQVDPVTGVGYCPRSTNGWEVE